MLNVIKKENNNCHLNKWFELFSLYWSIYCYCIITCHSYPYSFLFYFSNSIFYRQRKCTKWWNNEIELNRSAADTLANMWDIFYCIFFKLCFILFLWYIWKRTLLPFAYIVRALIQNQPKINHWLNTVLVENEKNNRTSAIFYWHNLKSAGHTHTHTHAHARMLAHMYTNMLMSTIFSCFRTSIRTRAHYKV